jgi:phosphoribosylanthranilate isomerase
MMVRVKICGITNKEDALCAFTAGADALGFVFAPSPRKVSIDQAFEIIRLLPPFVQTVGVFADSEIEEVIFFRNHLKLDLIQLSGNEDNDYVRAIGPRVIKTVHVTNGTEPVLDAHEYTTILFDTSCGGLKGGTGTTFDWGLAAKAAVSRPVILAGGLTPENVVDAITKVRPYAVDVSTGVEIKPGRKDHEKIKCFIQRAKTAGFDA